MTEKKNAPMRTGVVTSDKRDKTRKVEVQFLAKHPKYGKYLRKRTVLHVHDQDNASHIGDKVEVEECTPMSKTKSWRIVKVITQAPKEFATH